MSSPSPPRFAAFSHRNFRLFWTGNLVSLVGTLAQQAAMGWLARTLTTDPRLVTLAAASSTLPILFLSIFSGAVADRVDKRRALFWLNIGGAMCALILGLLVQFQIVRIWHVLFFALLGGAFSAFDIPIRQSFNVEMVGKKDLPSAIALNSTAFNSARVLGPAVGGFLIHGLGIARCFFVNALSFIGILIALPLMNLPAHETKTSSAMRGAVLWRGVLFVRRHAILKLVILLVAAVSFCAMSFSTLLPIFARDVFQTDARGYSILLACNGVGALLAASIQAAQSEMRHKGKRLLGGALGFCASTLIFAIAPNLILADATLIFSGFFLLTFLMAANTLVQTLSPDSLRGRIFAFYSMSLIGATPLGALVLGVLAKGFGARGAVAIGASVAALFVLAMFGKARELWKEK